MTTVELCQGDGGRGEGGHSACSCNCSNSSSSGSLTTKPLWLTLGNRINVAVDKSARVLNTFHVPGKSTGAANNKDAARVRASATASAIVSASASARGFPPSARHVFPNKKITRARKKKKNPEKK